MGRRGGQTKYTEHIAAALEAAVRNGLTNKDACVVAGISEDTLANWSKGTTRGIPTDFSERITRARAERSELLLTLIRNAAIGVRDGKGGYVVPPDWRAAGELLDRTAPDYRKPSRLELTGEKGGPVRHDVREEPTYDYSNLTLEEQFAFDQLLAKVADPAGVT